MVLQIKTVLQFVYYGLQIRTTIDNLCFMVYKPQFIDIQGADLKRN